MERLINETYESLNNVGIQVDKEISQAMKPIVEKWANAGYSVTNIEWLCNGSCGLLCAEYKLIRATKLAKNKGSK